MRSDNQGRAVQVGRLIGDPVTLALGVVSASVALTAFRFYRLWSSVDSFVRFGDAAVVATTSSHPLRAGLDTLAYTNSENFIAGIVSAGTGTLFISEIEVREP